MARRKWQCHGRSLLLVQVRLGCNAELILDEFGEKLLEELDYQQEARNIQVSTLTYGCKSSVHWSNLYMHLGVAGKLPEDMDYQGDAQACGLLLLLMQVSLAPVPCPDRFWKCDVLRGVKSFNLQLDVHTVRASAAYDDFHNHFDGILRSSKLRVLSLVERHNDEGYLLKSWCLLHICAGALRRTLGATLQTTPR